MHTNSGRLNTVKHAKSKGKQTLHKLKACLYGLDDCACCQMMQRMMTDSQKLKEKDMRSREAAYECPHLAMQQEESLKNFEHESEGHLLESWRENSTETGVFASALRAIASKDGEAEWEMGDYLQREGDPFIGYYKIDDGDIELEYLEEIDSDSECDEDQVNVASLSFQNKHTTVNAQHYRKESAFLYPCKSMIFKNTTS